MKVLINNKKKTINGIRELFAIILLIWSINPKAKFYSGYIYVILLLFWLLFAYVADTSSFIKTIRNKGFIIAWIFPLFLLVGSLFNYTVVNPTMFLIVFIYFMFWYYYNHKNIVAMRKIFFSGTIYCLIIAVYSIYILNYDSGIARFLASGNQSITEQYAHPFLADFTYIYSVTLLIVAFMGLLSLSIKLKIDNSKKTSLLISIVIIFTVMIKAQYMISLILFLLFSALTIYSTRKRNHRTIILQLLCLVIIILILVNLQDIIFLLADLTKSKTLRGRLIDIGEILRGTGVEGTYHLSLRLKCYLISIDTFLSNPIIGIGRTTYLMDGKVGGHSVIFDNLAYYGIIGTGFLLLSLIVNFRLIASKFKKEFRRLYLIICILYLLECVFNLCYELPILWILYIIIPFGINVYIDKYSATHYTKS